MTSSRNSRARLAKTSTSAGSVGRGNAGAEMFSQQRGTARPESLRVYKVPNELDALLRTQEKEPPAMRLAGAALAEMCALCNVGPRGGAELAGKTRGEAAVRPLVEPYE